MCIGGGKTCSSWVWKLARAESSTPVRTSLLEHTTVWNEEVSWSELGAAVMALGKIQGKHTQECLNGLSKEKPLRKGSSKQVKDCLWLAVDVVRQVGEPGKLGAFITTYVRAHCKHFLSRRVHLVGHRWARMRTHLITNGMTVWHDGNQAQENQHENAPNMRSTIEQNGNSIYNSVRAPQTLPKKRGHSGVFPQAVRWRHFCATDQRCMEATAETCAVTMFRNVFMAR